MIPITVKGKSVEVFVVGRNITEQRNMEVKMKKMAYYDEHTGLPNRMKFDEALVKMLNAAKKETKSLTVMFLYLDRFKVINDTLGHHAGDVVF